MRVGFNFNIDFNVEDIARETGKSTEELKEYIYEKLPKHIEEILKYELEDEGLTSISGVNVTQKEK